jgi:hypothetical protein
MLIKSLPDLIRMLNIYKNPYLIKNYKGTDWFNYYNYNNNINILNLSDDLSMISMKNNKYYKLYNKEFIYVLEGELLIGYNKKIESQYFYNENKDFLPCKGLLNYNTFLCYKSSI